jgi:hypothetical protein
MFGGRFGPRRKQLSYYELREKARQKEYARYRLTTFAQQQEHEERKGVLGEDYRDRYSGSWREAEDYMNRSRYDSWWDWLMD